MGLAACICYQLAPEQRLPAGFRIQGFLLAPSGDYHILALLPGRQPVGPEHLVLVEQVGHFLGQLKVAQVGIAAVQESGQWRKRLILPHQLRQQSVQPPDQAALVEGGLLRYFAVGQHRPIGLPDEPGRKQEIHAGGNAQAAFHAILGALLRQRQLQPLGNAVTLHQKGLALQRRHGVLPADIDHGAAQVFQMVGMDGVKAGFNGCGVGHGFPCLMNNSILGPQLTAVGREYGPSGVLHRNLAERHGQS